MCSGAEAAKRLKAGINADAEGRRRTRSAVHRVRSSSAECGVDTQRSAAGRLHGLVHRRTDFALCQEVFGEERRSVWSHRDQRGRNWHSPLHHRRQRSVSIHPSLLIIAIDWLIDLFIGLSNYWFAD